jgi:hypothetical protein
MDMCRLGTVQGGEDEVRKVLDDFQAPTSSFSLDKHEKEINECFGRETVCGHVCLCLSSTWVNLPIDTQEVSIKMLHSRGSALLR